jgi:hypothetical protein
MTTEATTKVPPVEIWNDVDKLLEWRKKNFNETEDKSKSWVRGFAACGRRQDKT